MQLISAMSFPFWNLSCNKDYPICGNELNIWGNQYVDMYFEDMPIYHYILMSDINLE